MSSRYDRVREKLAAQSAPAPEESEEKNEAEEAKEIEEEKAEKGKKDPWWYRFLRRLLINAIRVSFAVLFLKFLSRYVPIDF